MSTSRAAPGHYLIASDFDQTLSFNDSGHVLSELIGVRTFGEGRRALGHPPSPAGRESLRTSFATIPSSGACAAST